MWVDGNYGYIQCNVGPPKGGYTILRLFRPVRLQHLWDITGHRSLRQRALRLGINEGDFRADCQDLVHDPLYEYPLWKASAWVMPQKCLIHSSKCWALGTSLASLKHCPSPWDITGLTYIPLGRDTVYPILVWQLHVRYRKEWRANNGVLLITLPNDETWDYCCWEARFSLVGVACVYSVYCNIWQVHAIVTEVLQTHCILPCCTWRVFYGCGYHLIVLSCSHWHQWCMLCCLAISLSWRCL